MQKDFEPAGYCPNCEYRLDGGRCPECGAQVKTPLDSHPRQRPKRNRRISGLFSVGAALGWLTWWASPLVTRQTEPWDGSGSYYVISTVVSGIVTALVFPRFFWLAPIAIGLGQTAYMHIIYAPTLPMGGPAILPPCCGVALFGFLPALAGAAVVFGISKLAIRRNQ